MVVGFIDAHKDRFGVAPICRVLTEHGCQIAPSTYYAARSRAASQRERRDELVLAEIRRCHDGSRGLYGRRKIFHQLRREGIEIDGRPVAMCTIERIMREHGLSGVRRGRFKRTTLSDPAAARAADLVGRAFTAAAPNRLWVVDFTYVATWSGFAYAAFAIDVFSRMIVGWRVARTMGTDLPLDALEMALWHRARADHRVDGLIHHSDAGSQGGFNRSSQHLAITEVLDVASSAACRSGASPGDALTGPADPGSACGARVLALDRAGKAHGGRRARGLRVSAGRDALVSPRWRHATAEPGRADRPLLVV